MPELDEEELVVLLDDVVLVVLLELDVVVPVPEDDEELVVLLDVVPSLLELAGASVTVLVVELVVEPTLVPPAPGPLLSTRLVP